MPDTPIAAPRALNPDFCNTLVNYNMTVRIERTRSRERIRQVQLLTLPYDQPLTLLPTDAAWLALDGERVVGFGVLRPVRSDPGYGYLARAGVIPEYRGQGLQRRLIRARERGARKMGMTTLVTDTSRANLASSNSLIREGYKLYNPARKWAFSDGNYWLKRLG